MKKKVYTFLLILVMLVYCTPICIITFLSNNEMKKYEEDTEIHKNDVIAQNGQQKNLSKYDGLIKAIDYNSN